MPNFDFENSQEGIIAGVDEAGRGPWAGPVVAAAVILNKDNYPEGLDDSKKLSKAKREKLFNDIISFADFGVGIVEEDKIDKMNILQASLFAMQLAIQDLLVKPSVALVDGNKGFEMKDTIIVPIIKGDEKSLSISAASIVAKVSRDRIMANIGKEFPYYSWESNSGYGTKAHAEAIEKHGITEHHRKSFAPIKKILELKT